MIISGSFDPDLDPDSDTSLLQAGSVSETKGSDPQQKFRIRNNGFLNWHLNKKNQHILVNLVLLFIKFHNINKNINIPGHSPNDDLHIAIKKNVKT